MQKRVEIEEFLELSQKLPIIDVRSPSEYNKGHIPSAHNVYLFSDEERHKIGIIYKQHGKDKAILAGLDIIGPKMKRIVNLINNISEEKQVLIYCWRGGMRSNSVSWLLNLCGFDVYLLSDGYKTFRNHVLSQFEKPRKINILGGKTGSAKTHILYELKNLGEQILDIEKIATHKGSAFGGFEHNNNLTNEFFENLLALELLKTNSENTLWVEDESRVIGNVSIPGKLWDLMREAPVYFLEVSKEQRIINILKDYGNYPKEMLINSVNKISKKLGGLETKNCIESIEKGNLKEACEILLKYYDKLYLYSLGKRNHKNIKYIDLTNDSNFNNAKNILENSIKNVKKL